MIDMKQIKENVSSKIKTYQTHSGEAADNSKQVESRQSGNVITSASNEGSAAIGASIRIRGDVSGDENLVIQGQVDGTVKVEGHNVTISTTGKVRANISAKQIIIEGELIGDMAGQEKVIIRKSGNVRGNIVAPRVMLEDGAVFKGSIEMEPGKQQSVKNDPSITRTLSDSGSTDLKSA